MLMETHQADDLIRRYRKGDSRAFEELVECHGRKLFNYILYHVGDRFLAEDIYQDTFCRLLGALERYRPEGKFVSFLYTIAGNSVRDAMRKKKGRDECLVDEITLDKYSCDPLVTPGCPESALAHKELQRELVAALKKLDPLQRQVFLLRQVAELSFREIAAILDCPLNTALGRMHYALLNLRKILVKEDRSQQALLLKGGETR